MRYEIRPIGVVESPLVDPASAPKQGVEGSPEVWLAFDPAMADGIRALAVGGVTTGEGTQGPRPPSAEQQPPRRRGATVAGRARRRRAP